MFMGNDLKILQCLTRHSGMTDNRLQNQGIGTLPIETSRLFNLGMVVVVDAINLESLCQRQYEIQGNGACSIVVFKQFDFYLFMISKWICQLQTPTLSLSL